MGTFQFHAPYSRKAWIPACALGLIAISVCAAACTDDPTAASPDGTATYDEPLYMLMSNVYLDEDRTVYLVPMPSLDVDDVSLDDGREFSGVANFEAIGGRLLVSSGESPTITEYAISDDFEWREGETVS